MRPRSIRPSVYPAERRAANAARQAVLRSKAKARGLCTTCLCAPVVADRTCLSDPARFSTFNAENGWGLYVHFVPFVEQYLQACEANPGARISVSR